MDGITVTLARWEAALLLYAARFVQKQLGDGEVGAPKDGGLAGAIRAFERQLPVDLSRIVDDRVVK